MKTLKEEVMVKTFIPRDQTNCLGIYDTINKMCDDFLREHPELEEISREINSESIDKISCCYRTSFTIYFGIITLHKK